MATLSPVIAHYMFSWYHASLMVTYTTCATGWLECTWAIPASCGDLFWATHISRILSNVTLHERRFHLNLWIPLMSPEKWSTQFSSRVEAADTASNLLLFAPGWPLTLDTCAHARLIRVFWPLFKMAETVSHSFWLKTYYPEQHVKSHQDASAALSTWESKQTPQQWLWGSIWYHFTGWLHKMEATFSLIFKGYATFLSGTTCMWSTQYVSSVEPTICCSVWVMETQWAHSGQNEVTPNVKRPTANSDCVSDNSSFSDHVKDLN